MQMNIAATNEIAGFIGSCLLDTDTGLIMAAQGGGRLDPDAVAALNATFLHSTVAAMWEPDDEDGVEEILITLTNQVHLIRPLEKAPSMFLFVALEKKKVNLGMARLQVKKVGRSLSM